MISPSPDVRTLRIDPATDPFMVLACDGIWNSMSSQEVVDFVAERIEKAPTKISSICEEVCNFPQEPLIQDFLTYGGIGLKQTC